VSTLGWLIIAASGVWWTARTSLPFNPQSPGLSAERRTRLVLPEGWGFFTRDAREKDLLIAMRDDDATWHLQAPHASAQHLFGLHRRSRVLAIETGQIIEEARAPFVPCSDDWRVCAEQAKPHMLESKASRPYLCGDIALFRRPPVPWAWSNLLDPERMPTDLLRLRIRCNHGNG